jgi:hypothetical protein
MEFWQDERKIAFTTRPPGPVSFAMDTWEENTLVGAPFMFTASFITEADARVYLTAKYPHAVETIINVAEEAASILTMTKPRPPQDQRDHEAWRKYRADSHRLR